MDIWPCVPGDGNFIPEQTLEPVLQSSGIPETLCFATAHVLGGSRSQDFVLWCQYLIARGKPARDICGQQGG